MLNIIINNKSLKKLKKNSKNKLKIKKSPLNLNIRTKSHKKLLTYSLFNRTFKIPSIMQRNYCIRLAFIQAGADLQSGVVGRSTFAQVL